MYTDPDGRNPILWAAAYACARSSACVTAGVALTAATGKAISSIIKNESIGPSK